jgi:hypothetical protein
MGIERKRKLKAQVAHIFLLGGNCSLPNYPNFLNLYFRIDEYWRLRTFHAGLDQFVPSEVASFVLEIYSR